MQKNIKLIASDLDGTLLQNGSKKCTDELFPLLDQLAENDVFFVPSSGRQYCSLLKLFRNRTDKMLYLCENGALAIYQDQVIYKKQFSDELALDICHTIYDNKYCEVLISGERTSYLIPKSQEYVRHLRDDVGNNVTIINRPEEIAEPIIKVSYCTQEQHQAEVTKEFRDKFKGLCDIVVSGNKWVDFAMFGTNKGTALEHIGAILDISADQMCAFGDNENDREMLSYVGNPYLMENCNPTMSDIKAKRCYRVEKTLKEMISM